MDEWFRHGSFHVLVLLMLVLAPVQAMSRQAEQGGVNLQQQ